MEDCGIEKIPDGVLKSTTLKTLYIYIYYFQYKFFLF